MAHQTFYIDIDEEITSVIERLRGARAKEIVLVVPKRALLIQSIVNLRILKREADEADMQLMMVTQDKLGKILIEKAGIFVQQKMDNMVDEEISLPEESAFSQEEYEKGSEEVVAKDGKNRLESIGTESYFDAEMEKDELRIDLEKEKKKKLSNQVRISGEEKEQLVNKELVTGIGSDIRKKQIEGEAGVKISSTFIPIPPKPLPEEPRAAYPKRPGISVDMKNPKTASREAAGRTDDFFRPHSVQNKKITDFFHQSEDVQKTALKYPSEPKKDYSLSADTHKWFWIFAAVFVVLLLGTLAYLFVPKTDVVLTVETREKNIDSQITGDSNITSLDYDRRIIPARVVTIRQEAVKKFDSTGAVSVSNQKARGTVTIYNEYSSAPQPLVATTRLLSEDGKLFRLVAGVSVPGMDSSNGEIKPGSVEAQVVADQSGEEFNIAPTRFKIPGFQNSGNEKYNKFYAESKEAMAGGGSGGAEVKSVTDEDIAGARTKIIPELEAALKEKITQEVGEDALVLDGALDKEEAVYKLSNSQGDVVDSFEIIAETSARALVVSKKDLNDLVARMIERSGNAQDSIYQDSVILDFGKPNVDFEKGVIEIKFHATGKINPELDLALIKNEILGKNEDDLKEYLSTFSDIEKVEVNYWPSFINSRIPFRASRVEVTIDSA